MNAQIPEHLNSACNDDLCPHTYCRQAVKPNASTGRWFITIGHAGFNSPANNADGYATRAKALAAYRRYSGRRG